VKIFFTCLDPEVSRGGAKTQRQRAGQGRASSYMRQGMRGTPIPSSRNDRKPSLLWGWEIGVLSSLQSAENRIDTSGEAAVEVAILEMRLQVAIEDLFAKRIRQYAR